jgi:hypothetical protein
VNVAFVRYKEIYNKRKKRRRTDDCYSNSIIDGNVSIMYALDWLVR